MERTLIQLKSDFADMADKHKQINSFFWGNFVDAINQDAVDYPLMCCTLQPSQIGDSYTGVDLQVIICDKYNEQDYRMIDEVHSDMLRILKDIDVTLKQFRFQDYLDLETDFSTEPFINEGQDITAGWGGVIRMRVHDYENRCAIPYDGFDFDGSTTGTGCQPANYIVQYDNGTLIEQGTIPSGGSVLVEVPNPITCQNANYTLTDSLGNVLDSGTIASGGSATITAPDATVNVNKSDGTLIASVTAPSGGAEPYNVADSVITVNSDAYTDLLATDSLNIPIVDSNGDAVATTVVGSDVQVDDLPCATPTDEWIRPADWLDMPVLTSADDEIALLHAVWDNDSNFAALRCATTTGDYQVDWGDGTVTTHASNVVAEHQYDYSTYDTSGATLSSRGYKQAMIRITPLTGGLATFSTKVRYSTQNQPYATGYLDVLLSMPNASSFNSMFQEGSVSNRYMEQVEILNSGGVTDCQRMFQNCSSLQSVPLFDTGGVTNMFIMFFGCTSLQTVALFDTSSVMNMSNMFNGCNSLQSVPLFDTSIVTTFNSMFRDCNSLQSVPLFDTSSVMSMPSMFQNCSSLQSVPLFDTSSVMSMSNMFNGCIILGKIPPFDTSDVTNFSRMFQNCFSLQSVPEFSTISATNMTLFLLTVRSFSKTDTIFRVSVTITNGQLSRDGIVNIFNNLIDLTGLTSQNININGNYGVADLSTADLEIATDKNWTVTT